MEKILDFIINFMTKVSVFLIVVIVAVGFGIIFILKAISDAIRWLYSLYKYILDEM